MMMATMPSTTTTAGLAPFRVSTLVSRAANWPPVEAWSTQEDQASPARSSSDGSSTPTAEVAAMTTSPEPTSMSGFALRVRAIRPPAMITPSTATAMASGRIHCWSWPTAGLARQVRGRHLHPPGKGLRHHPGDPGLDGAGDPVERASGGSASGRADGLADDEAGGVDEHRTRPSAATPRAGEDGVAAQRGQLGGRIPPVAAGRGDHLPVTAVPDELDLSRRPGPWFPGRPGPALTRSMMAAAGV